MSRTTIVTGVSSFVGLHLVRRFVAEGDRVVALHSKPAAVYDGIRKARLDAVGDVAELIEADIADAAAINALIEREQPGLWIHHAGYAENYGSPDYDLAASFAVNVTPLPTLFQALEGRECGVIVTGSSAEYSTSDAANREDDACLPDTPYGLSKLAETLAARQLAHRFAVPTRVARLYIPFGTYDNPQKLLAQVIAALDAGKPVGLSPCTQKRDFIGVSDLCEGYAALAGDMERTPFDIFNLSSGEAVELSALLTSIARQMGADPGLLRFGERAMRPGEPEVSYGANDKARRLLDWTPRPLEISLKTDLLENHQ